MNTIIAQVVSFVVMIDVMFCILGLPSVTEWIFDRFGI